MKPPTWYLELPRLRHLAVHEAGERLFGVEEQEVAGFGRRVDINQTRCQLLRDGGIVRLRGNHDGGMPRHESIAEETADRRNEAVVVAVELDGVMMPVQTRRGSLGHKRRQRKLPAELSLTN